MSCGVVCRFCGNAVKLHGRFGPERRQRYRCKTCGKTFSEPPKRLLGHLRVNEQKGIQAVKLLTEGMGIRAISRIVGIHQATVLNILNFVGDRCAKLLDRKLTHLECPALELDELWARVGCAQATAHPSEKERGDFYTFLALDARTKLLVTHLTGKRTEPNTKRFVSDLSKRVVGRTQITCDGWRPYVTHLRDQMLPRLDLAVLRKIYHRGDYDDITRRYGAPMISRFEVTVKAGAPRHDRICTNHIERANLTMRTHNRRFHRLGLGYSKKLRNHRSSVALFVADYNFCKVHSTTGCTPAVGARITGRRWKTEELLRAATK